MKTIFLFLMLLSFSISSFSQELTGVHNFSELNNILSPKNTRDKQATKTKDFSFTVNPYLWTIAIDATIGIPGTPVTYPQTYEVNKSFSDALDNLKMAFMIGGKFKYKRVALLYDIVYANLKRFGATLPSGSGLASANITFKELITDLSLAYSFPTKSKSTFIDAYAGARIWSLENELTLIANSTGATTMRSNSVSWVDPLVGINVSFLLSPKWFSYLRGDLGGFGLNSKFSFMVLGGFGYRFSPNFNTTLGVKNLSIDHDKDGTLANMNEYGMIISLGYVY